jgi:hypothetical protein
MLIILNSKDGTGTNSNFQISLTNPINQINSIKLKEVGLNYKPYNISSALGNSTLTFTESIGGSFSFTVADGYYQPDELCLHIANGLNASSMNQLLYSVSYNPNTFCYSIQSTGTFYINNTGLGLVLGYTSAGVLAGTQTSNINSVIKNNYYYINITELTQNVGNNAGLIGTFCFNLNNGNITSEYNGLISQIICNSNTSLQLSRFSVTILDSNKNILNLFNNSIYLILEII